MEIGTFAVPLRPARCYATGFDAFSQQALVPTSLFHFIESFNRDLAAALSRLLDGGEYAWATHDSESRISSGADVWFPEPTEHVSLASSVAPLSNQPPGGGLSADSGQWLEVQIDQAGHLRLPASRPRLDGTQAPNRTWAVFENRPGERGRVRMVDGVVTEYVSGDGAFRAIFAQVYDRAKGRHVTSFYRTLPAKEFKHLLSDHEVHDVTLDGKGNLVLHGYWLSFGPAFANQRCRVVRIAQTARGEPLILEAHVIAPDGQILAQQNNMEIYRVPKRASEESFETADFVGLFRRHREKLGSIVDDRDNLLSTYIVKGIRLPPKGILLLGGHYWGSFREHAGAKIEAKVIGGKPAYIRVIEDRDGQPIRDAHNPGVLIVLDVRKDLRAQNAARSKRKAEQRARRLSQQLSAQISRAMALVALGKFSAASRQFALILSLRGQEGYSDPIVHYHIDQAERERESLLQLERASLQMTQDSKASANEIQPEKGLYPRADEEKLVAAIESNDATAKTRLVESLMGILEEVASEFANEDSERLQELMAEGVLELYKVVDLYLRLPVRGQTFKVDELAKLRLHTVFSGLRRQLMHTIFMHESLSAPVASRDDDEGKPKIDFMASPRDAEDHNERLARLDWEAGVSLLSEEDQEIARAIVDDHMPVRDVARRFRRPQAEIVHVAKKALQALRDPRRTENDQEGLHLLSDYMPLAVPQTRQEADILAQEGERALIPWQKALSQSLPGIDAANLELRRHIWDLIVNEAFAGEIPRRMSAEHFPRRNKAAVLKTMDHALYEGHLPASGYLIIGALRLGYFRSEANRPFVVEIQDGWPVRIFFPQSGVGAVFFPVRDRLTGKTLAVHRGVIQHAEFKRFEDVQVHFQLGSAAEIRIGGGRPDVRGRIMDTSRAWAYVQAEPFERGMLNVRRGIVVGFESAERDYREAFGLVWDRRHKRYTTCISRRMGQAEITDLDEDFEIHDFLLDNAGDLFAGGRRWFRFGSAFQGLRARVSRIEKFSNGDVALRTAIVLDEFGRVLAERQNVTLFTVPASAPAESFRRAKPLKTHSQYFSALDALPDETGSMPTSGIFANATTDRRGSLRIGNAYWGRFPEYANAIVDAKFIEAKPAFVRFAHDGQGKPIWQRGRKGKPIVIDLRQSVATQMGDKSPARRKAVLTKMRHVFEEAMRAFGRGEFAVASREFASLFVLKRNVSGSLNGMGALMNKARIYLDQSRMLADLHRSAEAYQRKSPAARAA